MDYHLQLFNHYATPPPTKITAITALWDPSYKTLTKEKLQIHRDFILFLEENISILSFSACDSLNSKTRSVPGEVI